MTPPGSTVSSDIMSDEAIMSVVCARADSAVFGELVVRWQQRVHGLCLRLTGNLHDAEDAVQETFTRVFAARGQFRGGAMFSTWLWRIAINTAQDLHRRRRPMQSESVEDFAMIPDECHQPSENAADSEIRIQVCRALQELPDELRIVVVLRHYQQLKFREIADVLDIPVGTVCARMTAGLTKLGHALKHLNRS